MFRHVLQAVLLMAAMLWESRLRASTPACDVISLLDLYCVLTCCLAPPSACAFWCGACGLTSGLLSYGDAASEIAVMASAGLVAPVLLATGSPGTHWLRQLVGLACLIAGMLTLRALSASITGSLTDEGPLLVGRAAVVLGVAGAWVILRSPGTNSPSISPRAARI